jgi:methylmalonyl-CoA mutase
MATFSAAIGGANAISVLPFTAPLGLPDRFARRIARNTQLILLEESSLAKVSDPAAGSGGIEDLTAKLCARTWALFQEIERAGGAAAAIEQGLIQKNVAAVRAARERAIAERRELITGTTAFPHAEDVPISVLKATPVKLPGLPKAIEFAPLTPRRLAEPHESTKDGPLP